MKLNQGVCYSTCFIMRVRTMPLQPKISTEILQLTVADRSKEIPVRRHYPAAEVQVRRHDAPT
jgi:hypothetical protein